MRSSPVRDSAAETFDSNDDLSAEEGIEVLLHQFLGVLNGLEPHMASRIKEEIANRFGGRFCSGTTCTLMAELINGYLSGDGRERLARLRSADHVIG